MHQANSNGKLCRNKEKMSEQEPKRRLSPRQRQAREIEAAFFWSLHGRSAEELPGLDKILEKYGLPEVLPENIPSEAKVQEFLKEARRRGLIREEKKVGLVERIKKVLL